MSIRPNSRSSLLTAVSVLGLLLTVGGAVAEAGSSGKARGSKAASVADRGHREAARPQQPRVPRGDSSRHTEVQRTDNGHTSHSTRTGADGRTATRDAAVVNDRETGTRTRDVNYTGADGKTRTVNDVAQRTDDGYTRNSTYTNAQGQSATRSAVVTNDPDSGSRTRDVTYTGADGQTATSNTVTTRTDSGYVSETTVTGPNGASGTRSLTVSCDKAAGQCTKDVQVNDGADSGGN